MLWITLHVHANSHIHVVQFWVTQFTRNIDLFCFSVFYGIQYTMVFFLHINIFVYTHLTVNLIISILLYLPVQKEVAKPINSFILTFKCYVDVELLFLYFLAKYFLENENCQYLVYNLSFPTCKALNSPSNNACFSIFILNFIQSIWAVIPGIFWSDIYTVPLITSSLTR